MATTISTRVEGAIAREIDLLSKEKHMDRATMLRNLLVEGLKHEKRRRVVELYRREKISMGKAREMLEVDLDEWLKIMHEEGLQLHYDAEMLEEDRRGISA